MCGLACSAIFGSAGWTADNEVTLDRMTEAVFHRGPDEAVREHHGSVGIGFTRLSLVDPEGGGQPFHSRDGRLHLIANGEVYNHRALEAGLASGLRMQSDSDCEVLMHLYESRGLDFLSVVNGMLAVILHDQRRNKLVLARDRFGIKPLYFHRNERRLVAASEITALFVDPETPRRVDWRQALTSSALQAAPSAEDRSPLSWFEDIEYVEPGTVVEVDLADGRMVTHRWWSFPGERVELGTDADEITARYGALLGQAVRDCASADADLGLFLSGGIDSAAVAALAAPVTDLVTFSVVNASTVANGDAYHGKFVADLLGLEHHQMVVPDAHVPTPDAWRRFVWLLETPMAGPEAYLKHELHRYARSTSSSLKGMLLGAASDEFNGGYSSDLSGDSDWGGFQGNLSDLSRRIRPRSARLARWSTFLGAEILTPEADDGGPSDAYAQYLLTEYRKIYQYNVWHEDRTAAGSGIEARVPFLDHRLVELVTSVPPALRQRLLWDKQILRDAMHTMLPPEVVHRPKVPFFHGEGVRYTHRMVIDTLLANDMELVEQALDSEGGRRYLQADAVRELLREQDAGRGLGNVELVLRLVNLGLLDSMTASDQLPTCRQTAPVVLGTVTDGDGMLVTGLDPTDGGDGRSSPLPLDALLDWAEDVLLLAAVADPGTHYLTRNGAIEYVIDDELPEWLTLSTMIDGRRTVRELLELAGVDLEAVLGVLEESIDEGLLTVTVDPTNLDSSIRSAGGSMA